MSSPSRWHLAKLAALRQEHLSDTESVNHRAQEEIRQCKSASEKKIRGLLSEAAQYREELVIATDRVDAAERQSVVRSTVLQSSFAKNCIVVFEMIRL